jgi:hypothetical protein
MIQLPINSVDYDDVKKNFIVFLKNQGIYTDYNFESSGISSLINIFGYNIHYIGYYVKMALSESFVDSAKTIESLFSKAKLNGYVPKSRTAAIGSVRLTIKMNHSDEPNPRHIIIPKYSYFSGANIKDDLRNYYVLDDVVCYDRVVEDSGLISYTSPLFYVYEGFYKINKYSVINDNFQRFVIRDKNIDTNTIRVNVYEENSSNVYQTFRKCDNLFAITSSSNIFYISTNNEGYYEIFFGQDKFGTQPNPGNIVEILYISTTGEDGNGCTNMTYHKLSGNDNSSTSAFSIFQTVVLDKTYGGAETETVESMKFSIPNHYKRQNRNVIEDDYREFILSEFQSIDSVNVWGGEKHFERKYGSVFMCIKPRNTYFLSDSQIFEMKRILSNYSMKPVEIINPEYISINLALHIKINKKITDKNEGEIRRLLILKTKEYNNLYLDKFNNGLSDVDLINYIKNDYPFISRSYTTKTISKTFNIIYTKANYIIRFGNEVEMNTLSSGVFSYANKQCKLIDIDGKIFVVNLKLEKIIVKAVGTINKNGIIRLTLENVSSSTIDYNDLQSIKLTITPTKPDLDTIHNNILLIDKITVGFS